jgi:hypothetical protein
MRVLDGKNSHLEPPSMDAESVGGGVRRIAQILRPQLPTSITDDESVAAVTMARLNHTCLGASC